MKQRPDLIVMDIQLPIMDGALSLVCALCLGCSQSATAFPVDTAAISGAANVNSTVQAQYHERHNRHRITKCYREFIFGPTDAMPFIVGNEDYSCGLVILTAIKTCQMCRLIGRT